MQSYTKQYILSFFLSILSSFLIAQSSDEGKFYHPKAGYYTLGINGGLAYQSSDIRTSFDGWGAGLTLGKNLYYQPGALFSFDARLRGLYTRSFGFDGERSFDFQNNNTLNGTDDLNYLNYPTETGVTEGFIYQNHRTDIGELSLEGVLRFNKLREDKGILISLFGGIGIDGYLTRYDQASNGTPYYSNYANLATDLSKSATVSRLKDAVLDGDFETDADGFSDGLRVDWMPSLGVELGYQLSPNAAILLGHRTTFARNNILDGQQWADTDNDVYHYTSLGLEFNLEKAQKAQKPEIILRLPTHTPHTQSNRLANVRANIKHVNSAADVGFFVNNKEMSFEYANGNFAADFPLKPGRNELVIMASNPVGTSRKLLVINWVEKDVISTPEYTPPSQTGNLPNIRFISPNRNNAETEQSRYQVRASIEGVRNRNDIRFSLNGQTRSFNFDTRSQELSADINLAKGRNVIKINAQNQFGADEAQRNINLRIRGQAPQVRINRPTNNTTVPSSTLNLNASITNIDNSRDISVTVNGNRLTFFDFRNGSLNETINLRQGNNTIVVRAQNQYGSDEDRVNVHYNKATTTDNTAKPPVVNITAPVNNSTTSQKTSNLRATIKNVRSRNDVRLTVNGASVNNFNFNSLSGLLTANVNLSNGNNRIKVRASNAKGQDEQIVNVNYNAAPTGNKPEVTINTPANNPHTTSNQSITVKATAKHVSNKNQIKVWINNRPTNGFALASNGRINVQVSLKEGNNTVRIKVTNNYGSAEDNTTIRYNVTKNPPTVSITTPRNGASLNNSKVQIAATVNNATRNEISVLSDGKPLTTFTLRGNKLTAQVNVGTGPHSLVIKVTNKDGRDEDSVRYTYAAPAAKPVVTITKPSKSGATVRTATTDLTAAVKNVKSKSELAVKLNGKNITFIYNTRSRTLSAKLNLRPGKNTVSVTATNAGGTDTDTRAINYNNTSDVPINPAKPKINITSVSAPAINPFNPNAAKSTIIATIDNISSKNNIVFKFRGQNLSDFTWNSSTKTFTATVDLTRGENPFVIEARTKAGKDTKSRVIEF